MKKICIIGSHGMLAHQVVKEFTSRPDEFDVVVASRRPIDYLLPPTAPKPTHISFELNPPIIDIPYIPDDVEVIINCIGVISQAIDKNHPEHKVRSIAINSLFPHLLAKIHQDKKIIQIATDCVFSGDSPTPYTENSPHSPVDIYGQSKSLGEVEQFGFYNLRTSIIGHELQGFRSLLSWFLSQPLGSNVNGYSNHLWNGITTKAFAKICAAFVCNLSLPYPPLTIHITPDNYITKANLLRLFNKKFGRACTIFDLDTATPINRTLSTIHSNLVEHLWKHAGYNKVPTIEELVEEL